MILDPGQIEFGMGLRYDDRMNALAPIRVRQADDRERGYSRMGGKHRLDLRRIDILAARHDHVLQPIDDRDISVRIHPPDIAGVHPAVAQHRCGFLGPPPIAEHDVGTANGDLTRHPSGGLAAIGCNDPYFADRRRAAGRTGAAVRKRLGAMIGRREKAACRRQFGHAIGLAKAGLRKCSDEPGEQCLVNRRCSISDQTHAAGIEIGEARMIHQHPEHCGDEEEIGHLVRLDRVENLQGIEDRQEDAGRAREEREKQSGEPAYMEKRRGVEKDRAGRRPGQRQGGQLREGDARMAEHHALWLTRRPPRIYDRGEIRAAAKRIGNSIGDVEPRIAARDSIDSGCTDRHDAAQVRNGGADVRDQRVEKGIDDEDRCFAIDEREGNLGARPARVDRVDDPARPEGAEKIFGIVVPVAGQKRHPVARLDAQSPYRAGEARRPVTQFRPAQPLVAIDKRDGIRRSLYHSVQTLSQIHGIVRQGERRRGAGRRAPRRAAIRSGPLLARR